MIIKVTWFLQQQGQGWTMSLWRDIPGPAINGGFASANQVANLMMACTGKETQMTAIRISEEGRAFDSFLTFVIKGGDNILASEDPKTSLGVRMQNGGLTSRKLIFMRGIWDSIVVSGGQFDSNNAIWRDLFAAWKGAILQDRYGWVGVTARASANVTNYVVGPTGLVLMTLDAPLFAADPVGTRTSVRIAGLNGRSILNGQQVVIVKSPVTVETVQAFGAGPFVSNGRLTKLTKNFIQAAFMEPTRIGERKTGTPFLATRGRLRNRAKR